MEENVTNIHTSVDEFGLAFRHNSAGRIKTFLLVQSAVVILFLLLWDNSVMISNVIIDIMILIISANSLIRTLIFKIGDKVLFYLKFYWLISVCLGQC
jgi:hypothetical protein